MKTARCCAGGLHAYRHRQSG